MPLDFEVTEDDYEAARAVGATGAQLMEFAVNRALDRMGIPREGRTVTVTLETITIDLHARLHDPRVSAQVPARGFRRHADPLGDRPRRPARRGQLERPPRAAPPRPDPLPGPAWPAPATPTPPARGRPPPRGPPAGPPPGSSPLPTSRAAYPAIPSAIRNRSTTRARVPRSAGSGMPHCRDRCARRAGVVGAGRRDIIPGRLGAGR